MQRPTLLLLLVFTLPFGLPAQCDFIAAYPLDNNAFDVSGSSFHGNVIQAQSAPGLDGSSNSAFIFDGIDDVIVLNQNQPIVTSETFTISISAKMDGPGGGVNGQNTLFLQRGDQVFTGNSIITLHGLDENGNITMHVRDGTSTGASTVSAPHPSPFDGNWHCYTAVLDENNLMSLYLDGQLLEAASSSESQDFDFNIDYVFLGQNMYTGGVVRGAFNGSIDNVKIFDCALIQEQIQFQCNSLLHPSANASRMPLSSIKLFPNPATNTLHIDVPVEIPVDRLKLMVIGLDGQELLEASYTTSLSVSQLHPGRYFLHILNKGESIFGAPFTVHNP